jgi:sugar/nucleoside kinase (ribokinase family)
MDNITFACPDKRVLVLASANREYNIVTRDYSWSFLAGKKVQVYGLRESYENRQRSGYPDDPLKFYVKWKRGDHHEQSFFAKRVKFQGWAGSSFNITDHLVSLGVKNITLAAFVKDGPELRDLHDYCKEKGIFFIPLWASDTGVTFVFEDDMNADSAVCMQKPSEIDPAYNLDRLLSQKWDVIISSSTPASKDILKMNISIFEQNERAIKSLMPSLSLINSNDGGVKKLFRKLIGLSDVFQVNDIEAGRYLNLDIEAENKPIARRELVLKLVQDLEVSVVIVTMGKEGAAVVGTHLDVENDEDRYIYQRAFRETWTIKTTVGSGDAFHSGFMRIYMQAIDNYHEKCLKLAAHMGAELAIRNACVWGGNMSQDETKKISPEEFMGIVNKYGVAL